MKAIAVRILLAIFLFTSYSASAMPLDAGGDAASHAFSVTASGTGPDSDGDVSLGCDHACHAAQHFFFSVGSGLAAIAGAARSLRIAARQLVPDDSSVDPLRRPPRNLLLAA